MSAVIDACLQALSREDSCLIVDVGASEGSFTRRILDRLSGRRAFCHLFEPTLRSVDLLRKNFGEEDGVRIYPQAVGAEDGITSLYDYGGDGTTNSRLERHRGSARVSTVAMVAIDSVLAGTVPASLAILKSDVQGGELEVLRGASDFIARHRPVLQIEGIFVDRYHGQADHREIFAFVFERGYRLVEMAGMHCTQAGSLAFCDLVFAPEERWPALIGDDPWRVSACDIGQLTQRLEAAEIVVAERAAVIEGLVKTSADRLELVNALEQTCREREALINALHAECDRLRRQIASHVHVSKGE